MAQGVISIRNRQLLRNEEGSFTNLFFIFGDVLPSFHKAQGVSKSILQVFKEADLHTTSTISYKRQAQMKAPSIFQVSGSQPSSAWLLSLANSHGDNGEAEDSCLERQRGLLNTVRTQTQVSLYQIQKQEQFFHPQ